MVSTRQEEEFVREVIDLPTDILERAINWIKNNLSCEDVFDEKELSDWAVDNGYVKEKE